MAENNFNFEENLKNLESIIEKLQSGDCSLEESIDLFEKGIKYTNECRNSLETAKKRIITLTQLEEEATEGD